VKRWAAALVTLLLVSAAILAGRKSSPPSPATTPEVCVEQMFQAAQHGDVEGYLACFAGEQRLKLDRELAEQGPEAFADALRAAVEPLKGHAVFAAKSPAAATASGSDVAELSVERIYAHRNDLQSYRLRRSSGAWQIEALRSAENFQPPEPYGKPVFALPEDEGK
jgi:hypothetical protein